MSSLYIKKIILVFGTRPEAIKMAPLVKEFKKHPDKFETIVCVTGQHKEMLEQVLNLFDIIPDYDLKVMKAGQDLFDVTTKVMLGLRDVFASTNPDLVLVHGDTATSSSAALAAYYQRIPVAHVEAGLRTHNLYSPWPEEGNRQITSRLANLHFAPTSLAKKNLLDEGIADSIITVTGNTVIDALKIVTNKLATVSKFTAQTMNDLSKMGLPLASVDSWVNLKRKLILITGHRRENFGKGFHNICNSIKHLAEKYPMVDFVYPVHLNPNVQKPVYSILGENNSLNHSSCLNNKKCFGTNNNIFLIEPIEYQPFVFLMDNSYLILTDSGGIQEEAPSLGKPVLVMRDTTERPEAVKAGTVKLIGTSKASIIHSVSVLLDDQSAYSDMSKANNPYGNGFSCVSIVDTVIEYLIAEKLNVA